MARMLQIGKKQLKSLLFLEEECLEPWNEGSFHVHSRKWLPSKLWWIFRIIYSIALSEAEMIVVAFCCCRRFHFQWICTEMFMTEEQSWMNWRREINRNSPINLQQKNVARNLMLKNDIDFSFVISMGIVYVSWWNFEIEINWADGLGLRSTGGRWKRIVWMLGLASLLSLLENWKTPAKKRSKSAECCPIYIHILCKLFRPSPVHTHHTSARPLKRM